MLESVNPATGKTIARYEEHSADEINSITENAVHTQQLWEDESIASRSEKMRVAAYLLRRDKERYAVMITSEMGKPVVQARQEVEKCAMVCEYYADKAGDFLLNEYIETEAKSSYVAYRPLGVILGIMPWNFPFWQVFRFAVPCIMAGNTVLLKHASNVYGSALAIEGIFREAGFPENLFGVLKIPGKKAGDIIGNQHIKGVSLTGSVGAGRAVASRAGSMLKKTVLELGGSDPYIVLRDANLENAIEKCVSSRLINNGQSCISAKRFIIEESIYSDFEEGFTELMKSKLMGDPMSDDTDLGPQASTGLRDELHQQVAVSVKKGARCLLGGTIPGIKGAWYPATVLSGVMPGMPAYDEETFGPAAALIRVRDEKEAIAVANDSVFGLGGAIFTENLEKGRNIAERLLKAGCCFVNDMVRSDPRLPFGGISDSGFGRELSHHGIREFTNIKTVYIK